MARKVRRIEHRLNKAAKSAAHVQVQLTCSCKMGNRFACPHQVSVLLANVVGEVLPALDCNAAIDAPLVALARVWKLEIVLVEVSFGLHSDSTSAIDQSQTQFWDALEREKCRWEIEVHRPRFKHDRSNCPSCQAKLGRRHRSRPSSGAAMTCVERPVRCARNVVHFTVLVLLRIVQHADSPKEDSASRQVACSPGANQSIIDNRLPTRSAMQMTTATS